MARTRTEATQTRTAMVDGEEMEADIAAAIQSVAAPIAAGDRLGELVITLQDLPERRVPLVAETDVASGGFGVRLRTAALVLLDAEQLAHAMRLVAAIEETQGCDRREAERRASELLPQVTEIYARLAGLSIES